MRTIKITPVKYIYGTAKAYVAPKTIKNHPAVAECNDAVELGYDSYKHEVWLKEGWMFSSGVKEGCRCGTFNTVDAFKLARPVKTKQGELK